MKRHIFNNCFNRCELVLEVYQDQSIGIDSEERAFTIKESFMGMVKEYKGKGNIVSNLYTQLTDENRDNLMSTIFRLKEVGYKSFCYDTWYAEKYSRLRTSLV